MNEPAQPAPVGKPIRYLSVCSGMEAASVAWHPLGWTPVGFSEIEPFPCAILKHRFPNTPNYGSLTEYKQWPLEPRAIDLLVGGTPCQSFSVAGLRKGLEDPRGNLALVFLGLADKLKPRWIVWENVPGVLSSNGGRDFGSFLGALVELGYGFAYRVLDAQHFGVPQRRRRVFVVACLGDWRAPAEVLLESDCVRRDIKKGRAKGQGVASGAEGGVGADHPEGCWWDGGQVSQTLDAVLQKGQTMPEKNRFPAVLQPMLDTIGNLCADTHPGAYSGQDAYSGRLIPDQKPVGIDFRHERFERDGTVGTIQSKSTGGYPLNYAPGVAIPYPKSKLASSTTDNETWVEGDTSNTLNNFDLGDTRTTHAVVSCSDVSPTVVSSAPFSKTGNERVECEALIVQASELRLGGSSSEAIAEIVAVHQAEQATAMAVRRLTPVECERLQGFPDNWSRISWKGKPEDQCPDGPRYKACGNSMAVPVIFWIGERIAAVDAKHFPHA